MERKQIVIKVRRPGKWRGPDYGIVTDESIDVFARCVEIGICTETSKKIKKWAEKAEDGTILRKMETLDANDRIINVIAECRKVK